MGNLIDLRNKYKDEFEKSHGVKLGFMSAFVRVSVFYFAFIVCVVFLKRALLRDLCAACVNFLLWGARVLSLCEFVIIEDT